MTDRRTTPPIAEISRLTVPEPFVWRLSNGIPVYETNLGTQDIVKLDLLFYAGRPFERKQMVSRSTAALMREGTASHSSAAIAETMDYYGASLSMPIGLDTASVLLYSLRKHIHHLLPLVADILRAPTFPQDELEAFIERNQRRLQVDLSKNDIVAYRQFTEMLYGKEHPYGYNSFPETYAALLREDLTRHFEENYTAGNCLIFLSGRIDDALRRMLDEELGAAIRPGERRPCVLPAANTVPEQIRLPHPPAVQTAIRIGRHLFDRHHPDFYGMYVLNTILGGYFGSRLMANIREKKGYTYNIYSSHEALLSGGYFYVATEVGSAFVEKTREEIYRELANLQRKLVGQEELRMVRNYLLGTLLTNLDGPFNISEVVKAYLTEGVSLDTFQALSEAIRSISPAEIRRLARQYFDRNDMWEIIV
ncbi:MAG: hypothetical protein RLY31_621 [Bacteroidota bacterium]